MLEIERLAQMLTEAGKKICKWLGIETTSEIEAEKRLRLQKRMAEIKARNEKDDNNYEYCLEFCATWRFYVGYPVSIKTISLLNDRLRKSNILNNWIGYWCLECPSCGKMPTFFEEMITLGDFPTATFFGCDCWKHKLTKWDSRSRVFFKEWNDRAFELAKKKIGG